MENSQFGNNTRAIRNRAMVLVILLLFVFTGSAYFITQRLVSKSRRMAVNMAQQTATSNRNVLEKELARAANRTKFIAEKVRQSGCIGSQFLKERSSLIESVLASDPENSGLWFKFVEDAPYSKSIQFADRWLNIHSENNPFYEKLAAQAVVSGDVYISEPYYSSADSAKRLVVSVVYPSFTNEKLSFVVGLELDLKELHFMLSEIDALEFGYVSVVSGGGVVVNHPELSFIGKHTREIAPYGDALDNPNTRDTTITVESEFLLIPVIRFYSNLPLRGESKPWTISVSIPVIGIFGSSDEIQRMVIGFVVIAFSVIALMAVILFFVWKIENMARQKAEQATELLKQMQGKLINSEKLATLGLLTAGIAHEINNPINFVLANLEPLKRDLNQLTQIEGGIDPDPLREEIALLVAGIENGARRTADIVKDLGMFSRKETNLVSINIAEVIDSALALLHYRIKDRITVEKNYGNVPPIRDVSGNIVHVFLNILANAVDAVADMDGKGAIWIATGMRSRSVFISISDNGSGISAEMKRQIFEPFFTTKPAGQGVGLGLTITYGILEQSGATIEVLDRAGGGTQFLITFGHGNGN